MFRNTNLLNSKEPDCRRSKISNTGDQNLVGSVFDVREVLIIVGSLITDQHCPKKESIRYGHKPVASDSFWCLQLSHSNRNLSSHYTNYVQDWPITQNLQPTQKPLTHLILDPLVGWLWTDFGRTGRGIYLVLWVDSKVTTTMSPHQAFCRSEWSASNMKDGLRLIETPLKRRDQLGLISLNVDSVGNW